MAALIPQKMFDEQLAAMDIENFAQATIRQVGAVGGALEKNSGTEFLHLEMGVPGLPPETVGVEAEQQALAQGHASIYPSITGIAPLKSEASRFVKAFLDIDVAPEGCIPTVGSMQGGFCLFQIKQVRHDRSRRLGLHGHGLPQGAGTSFPGSVPGHRSPLYG